MIAKKSNQNLCDKCRFCPSNCKAEGVKFSNDNNVIQCLSFKTKVENILFRCSKIGLLAGGLIRHGLTDKQRDRMEELESITKELIGLSEKQQTDLDSWNTKVENGGTLSPTQMKKRDDYKNRLVTFNSLTPSQEKELQTLKEKNSRPPELSQGAKTYIKSVWLENEKGFREEVTDKKLRKGNQAEEDAITLISFVDRVMYVKNEERATKGHLTGECDVNTLFKDMELENGSKIDTRVIDDTKCSWNPRTFMNASLTVEYEWQLRAYMYLYNADVARLRHCLVDCPPDVLQEEYKRYCFQHNIIDDALPEYKELIDQFNRNYLYDNTGYYTQEERVKTFSITRDYDLEEILLKSIEKGVEYYNTITLNMID